MAAHTVKGVAQQLIIIQNDQGHNMCGGYSSANALNSMITSSDDASINGHAQFTGPQVYAALEQAHSLKHKIEGFGAGLIHAVDKDVPDYSDDLKTGTSDGESLQFINDQGFFVQRVNISNPAANKETTLGVLRSYLDEDYPLITDLIPLDFGVGAHAVVIVGYDDDARQIFLLDSMRGPLTAQGNRQISYDDFFDPRSGFAGNVFPVTPSKDKLEGVFKSKLSNSSSGNTGIAGVADAVVNNGVVKLDTFTM